jgi:hypothetical protein
VMFWERSMSDKVGVRLGREAGGVKLGIFWSVLFSDEAVARRATCASGTHEIVRVSLRAVSEQLTP